MKYKVGDYYLIRQHDSFLDNSIVRISSLSKDILIDIIHNKFVYTTWKLHTLNGAIKIENSELVRALYD